MMRAAMSIAPTTPSGSDGAAALPALTAPLSSTVAAVEVPNGDVAAQPYLIRDMASAERPRERLKRYGASSLSNAELIAVIWRTGSSGKERVSVLSIAQQALRQFQSLTGLAQATVEELTTLPGVGDVKAIELAAAFELGKRLVASDPAERPVVRSPREVVNLVQNDMALLQQEELWVLLLSSKNQVLAIRKLYRGTLNSSTVRVAELFRSAIRENCASVIIVHNHPSGDPTPSPEDVRVTAEAAQAGQLLDIEVLDHVIVGAGRDRYVSMKERGLGFS